MKNLLVAQSGGPTSAINATLAGVIQASMASSQIDRTLGAVNAIEGIHGENFIDFDKTIKNAMDIELLAHTPSSALGTCRIKIKGEEECKKLIDIFKKHEIAYFVYIGGNDSMDTVYQLSEYCKKYNIEGITVVGAPKTIDNDLTGTDHCPGFASAAKYIATTLQEIERDVRAYTLPSVVIVEIMGRDAGWLTASAVLAKGNGSRGPKLIYPCELPFSVDNFLKDVKSAVETDNAVIVAISEGIKDDKGVYISESVQSGQVDAFGHSANISGAGQVLAALVKEKLGIKVRSIELSLLQRCAAHIASKVDIVESRNLGICAALNALAGKTGMMSAIFRKPGNGYATEFGVFPTSDVVNKVKSLPREYINSAGNNITKECYDYLKPLIYGEETGFFNEGLPVHITDLVNGYESLL